MLVCLFLMVSYPSQIQLILLCWSEVPGCYVSLESPAVWNAQYENTINNIMIELAGNYLVPSAYQQPLVSYI